MRSWYITFTGFYPKITPTVVCFHQDAENDKNEQPLKHQTEISVKLGEAEGLLKDLFLDVDKAKKLKHHQAREIESEWVVGVLTFFGLFGNFLVILFRLHLFAWLFQNVLHSLDLHKY